MVVVTADLRHHAAMSETTGQVRVGDRERRAVDDLLLAAVADGVLTLSEYDERSRDLWQARTRGDLEALVADLPSSAPAVPAPRREPADGPVPPHRVVAVLSEDRFAGELTPGQDVEGWAVLGSAVVDLRREDLPDGVQVRVRAVLGDVEVQVPPGAVVSLSGLAVLGDRAVRTGAASAAGPVVHVDAVAVLGTVQVTHGDGTVVAGSRDRHPSTLRAPSSVAAATSTGLGRRSRGVRSVLSGLAGLLVPAAVLGGVVVAGPDAAAVFGSRVEHVREGQEAVAVSHLFGSVTVVVPDDVRVDPSGLVVFGSSDCDDACGAVPATGVGDVVEVRGTGAFGSVEILTESEWSGQRSDDVPDGEG